MVDPLIAIVGPTASGKSAAALAVAKRYNGEIICADSRTVYKGMDIGTAKPTLAEQREVAHHLLDIVEPDQACTAAEFKRRAIAAINDILSRGKLPILVGGTGLYVDSILYDFQFNPKSDPSERQWLNSLSVEQLQQEIQRLGLELPANSNNPRHLVRVIEARGAMAQKQELRRNTLVVGMAIDRESLVQRINARVGEMVANGLEAEARYLFEKYGQGCSSLQTIGYQEWLPFFDGTTSHDEVLQKIATTTRQYAKRQTTWFKRNKSIQWLSEQIQIDEHITTFLNK